MSPPERLGSILADLFCLEPHPFDDSALCRRLDGHSGVHAADGKAWETTTLDPKDLP